MVWKQSLAVIYKDFLDNNLGSMLSYSAWNPAEFMIYIVLCLCASKYSFLDMLPIWQILGRSGFECANLSQTELLSF